MDGKFMGQMLDASPIPESRKWAVALVAAAWFGTDEQVAYAQWRYEQECRKEDAMRGSAG